MVLDPSQTPWGRQLRISSSTRPVTPSSRKKKCSEPSDGEDDHHPRKKRKSDIGSVAGSGSVVHATPDVEAAPVVSASIDSVREPRQKPSAGPSKLTQTRLPGIATKAKNPRTNLRSQIAGFARSGSQVQPRPLSPSGDELDELDADEPLDKDEEVRDEGMIKKMAINVRPLQSSPEAATPPSDVVPDDTNPVDLPTSALNDDDEADDDPNSVLSQALATSYEDPSITPRKNDIRRPEIIRTEKDDGDLSLRFDSDRVVSVWSKKKDQRLHKPTSTSTESEVVEPERVPSEAGVSNTESDAKAADALARVIEKSDFESMAVIGQFNLGFIVVRRERALEEDGASAQTRHAADDLFIVDQHAADEKYNFETLQATTKIASQKLFRCLYLSFCFLCQGKLRMLFFA